MARPVRHPETRDVWPGTLLLSGAGLLAFLILAAIVLRLVFNTAEIWPPAGASARPIPSSAALQRFPVKDLTALRKAEDRDLGELGWVDRSAGIARIPIDQAMKLIVANGLPDWSKPAAAQADCGRLEADVPRAPQAGRCRQESGASP